MTLINTIPSQCTSRGGSILFLKLSATSLSHPIKCVWTETARNDIANDPLLLNNVAVSLRLRFRGCGSFKMCKTNLGLSMHHLHRPLKTNPSASAIPRRSSIVPVRVSQGVCVCVLQRAKINRQLSHNIHLGVYVCLISTKKKKKIAAATRRLLGPA